jgi:hypothetical protein
MSSFEDFERLHPEDFSVSTVEDVFNSDGQAGKSPSGRWRECGDGKDHLG